MSRVHHARRVGNAFDGHWETSCGKPLTRRTHSNLPENATCRDCIKVIDTETRRFATEPDAFAALRAAGHLPLRQRYSIECARCDASMHITILAPEFGVRLSKPIKECGS